MKPQRPILRYHGGKWELAAWIISRMPAHKVYAEPFGGAASVLLQKPRSYAEVYNDLDGEIVNLFKVVREHPVELDRAIRGTPFSRVEYLEAFDRTDQPIEWARRTLIRSHMGHAGAATHGSKSGFRSRTINSGSHPASQWLNLPEHILEIVERWRGVVIENRPATAVIESHDDVETLFYLDPPYVFSSRDKGNDYRFEMSDADHSELAECIKKIKGMAIISGYHSELYDSLYAGWRKEERQALAENASVRTEVLWFNDAAWRALQSRETTLFEVA